MKFIIHINDEMVRDIPRTKECFMDVLNTSLNIFGDVKIEVEKRKLKI